MIIFSPLVNNLIRGVFMSENLKFWKTFTKRSLVCFIVILSLFLSCILRVAVTATSNLGEIRTKTNCYKLKIGNLRGTIYDCNMVPLTNNKQKIIAAVSPTKKAITAIRDLLPKNEKDKLLKQLQNGQPIVCEIEKDIKCDGITTTKIYEHSPTSLPAVHLLGYTNYENHGVSGIEKAYDELLYSDKQACVYFESDGKGNILRGSDAVIENDSSITASGVITTLDINIQNIAEKAALNIENGAIVIAESNSGKIRAMVSRPFYDYTRIEDYLNNPDSPLFNRALGAYNVGSVFKPCVAVSGIENSVNSIFYDCSGSKKIVDRIFKCHKTDGHGIMTLKTALANSCNTYFYTYSALISGEKIYNTASALNFGNAIKLCDNIYTAKGSLPTKSSLENPAALANFSIGQGKMTLSPVSILTLYCAIATNGCYYLPSVVEKTVKDGKFTEYDKGNKTKVMNETTAKILRNYLKAVITDGTGEDAKPQNVTAAGKTATAQTGKYENGYEISQSWFCGFFPADEPKYVVVVFSENTKRQTKTCNKIFAEIADSIYS